jgi:hypothetical protein
MKLALSQIEVRMIAISCQVSSDTPVDKSTAADQIKASSIKDIDLVSLSPCMSNIVFHMLMDLVNAAELEILVMEHGDIFVWVLV